MEIDKTTLLASVLLVGGGGTGLNQFLEAGEDRQEIAQWKAINERMTQDQVKLYLHEKGCP